MFIRYNDSIKNIKVEKVNEPTDHTVRIEGRFLRTNLTGFSVIKTNGSIYKQYNDYTHLYRHTSEYIEYSNDGSTYYTDTRVLTFNASFLCEDQYKPEYIDTEVTNGRYAYSLRLPAPNYSATIEAALIFDYSFYTTPDMDGLLKSIEGYTVTYSQPSWRPTEEEYTKMLADIISGADRTTFFYYRLCREEILPSDIPEEYLQGVKDLYLADCNDNKQCILKYRELFGEEIRDTDMVSAVIPEVISEDTEDNQEEPLGGEEHAESLS